VEYAVETGQQYLLDFTFSEPDGSEGSTVTINPVMAGDRLASSEPRPLSIMIEVFTRMKTSRRRHLTVHPDGISAMIAPDPR